ncbi:MAG: FAD-dependent oxidoreductase [Acidobacteria bacterium]|nr:FAD-dependent oxidoreductase [Acidobacteriota bacterium]
MKAARVVGAGLSGLAVATCLADAGFDVEVIEAAAEPGGLIGTRTTPHGPVERAANAFVWTDTTAKWFERLRITPEFPLDTARGRYIYRDGKPRRWPLRRGETLAMGARLGWTYLTRRLEPRADESVAQFVERVAGPPASRWFASPAMQGVYATPADRLAAAAIFGRRRRARGQSAAPPGGMGEFIGRLYDDLRARGVTFSFNAAADFIGGNLPTVICTKAPAAASLVTPHAPGLAAALGRVDMTGIETVTTFFEPRPDDVQGFGVLFPRGSGIDALGVLFNTSIFRNRGAFRSETWIYAVDETTSATTPADRVAADREVLTGRRDPMLAIHPTRRPAALPVYDARVLALEPRLPELPPWLALSGNYLGQIGVSTLLARAETTVAALVAKL